MGVENLRHFLEQVPVGDHFQLLEHQKDSTSNEEVLVSLQSHVQLSQIPVLDTVHYIAELLQIVELQHLHGGHVTEEHLHRNQKHQYQSLVLHCRIGTVAKRERERAFRQSQVHVEHRLSAEVVLVGDLVGQRETLVEIAHVVNTADQWLQQVESVYPEVYAEQLVGQIEDGDLLTGLGRKSAFTHTNPVAFHWTFDGSTGI